MISMQEKSKRVFVVGGGPAGMMAAAQAAAQGYETILLEKNEKLGKKLFISGKGRCNVTNSCDMVDFFENIAHNSSFCYSAVYTFPPELTMNLIEEQGVPLKIERGGRVFPVSDKSSDVIKALERYVRQAGAEIRLNTRLENIFTADGKITGIQYDGKVRSCDGLILAMGGASYVSTGSDGAWRDQLVRLGHTVEEFIPALVPLTSPQLWVRQLQGLSLKNVRLKAVFGSKIIFDELGEMLFTHFGLSGPLVLSLSSRLEQPDFKKLRLLIDLKPGLTVEQLNNRLLRDFAKYGSKTLKNAMVELLPVRLIPAVITAAALEETLAVSQLSQEKRARLIKAFKELPIEVDGFRPLNEAIVTRGGISVKEIDPSTMQGKRIAGLFFAGEMIDIDAYTGGFNIQLALSTGFLAGSSC
jgi:flavoprotein family protein